MMLKSGWRSYFKRIHVKVIKVDQSLTHFQIDKSKFSNNSLNMLMNAKLSKIISDSKKYSYANKYSTKADGFC